jgi:hypothetical protein
VEHLGQPLGWSSLQGQAFIYSIYIKSIQHIKNIT